MPYLLSGLVYCSRCGFAFQGQSTRIGGRKYYRYICGGYNAKRVCDWTAVGRDALEEFVVEAVQGVLSRNGVAKKVERELEAVLDAELRHQKMETSDPSIHLKEIDRKLWNISTAIEEGAPVAMFRHRIDALQRERDLALEGLQESKLLSKKLKELPEISQAIRRFSISFRKVFEQAPVYEKRDMLRRSVWRIEVDGDAKVVRSYIRRLPLATPGAEAIVGGIEKTEIAVKNRLPFRNENVPGTHDIEKLYADWLN